MYDTKTTTAGGSELFAVNGEIAVYVSSGPIDRRNRIDVLCPMYTVPVNVPRIFLGCLDVPESLIKMRILHPRPTNWGSIAENADIFGNYATIKTLQEAFSNAALGTSSK